MIAVFLIQFILVFGVFIFNSCQTDSEDIQIERQAENNFIAALSQSKQAIISMPFVDTEIYSNEKYANYKSSETGLNREIQEHTQTVCFTFIEYEVDLDSAQEESNNLGEVLEFGGELTSIDGQEINTDNQTENNSNDAEQVCFEIPVKPTQEELAPVAQAARDYLYTKGFSNSEIDEMIIDENGQEEDLIALVAVMTSVEQQNNSTASINYLDLFFNAAYAQQNAELTTEEVGTCAAIAIGADILWALGGSNASSWSKGAMKRAFGKVASRFLGPIGVAIAVVTFGLCVLSESQD